MIRCHLCTKVRPPVPSIGPIPVTVLLLGEAPHRTEDFLKEPFTGDTGKEVNHVYLPLSGLPRSAFHIANARCCSKRDYTNPTPDEARACAETHLGPLLSLVKPKIIVPMGAVACSLFPGINLNTHHGLPRPGTWGPWEGIVFPTYHPTAGMRKTAYMIPLMNDFKALKDLVAAVEAGTFEWPSDPHPEPDYRVIRTRDELYEYYYSSEFEYTACDTESTPEGKAHCMTFSHTPGTGRLIYARDKDLIKAFSSLHHGTLLFHNYLHDVVPFAELDIPIGKFIDTMVYAYNLCLGGGGDDDDEESGAGRGSLSLKILSHRLLNMTMESFKDTVYPHSMPKLLEWLQTVEAMLRPLPPVALCTCDHPQESHSRRGKTNRPIGDCGQFFVGGDLCPCTRFKKAPQPAKDRTEGYLYNKLALLIRQMSPLKPGLDPWKRYDGWNEEDYALMEPVLGPPPRPSILHVPEPVLVNYACRDSDSTLRLWRFLRRFNPWLFRERR